MTPTEPIETTPAQEPPAHRGPNWNVVMTLLAVTIIALALIIVQPWNDDSDSETGSNPTPTTVAPTPSSQPDDTPTSTPAGPNSSRPRPFEIPAGTSATVLKGWCVEGDIRVNGVAMYDDDDTTGLVTCMTQDAVVEAQWGAYASDADANAQEQDMFRPGACGRQEGCHKVILKYAP